MSQLIQRVLSVNQYNRKLSLIVMVTHFFSIIFSLTNSVHLQSVCCVCVFVCGAGACDSAS